MTVITPELELATKAKQLIEESGWCQGSYAKNSDGYPTPLGKSDATNFCAVGACLRVKSNCWESYDVFKVAYEKVIDTMQRIIHHRSVQSWNDQPGRTVSEVLTLFDRTIERLGK